MPETSPAPNPGLVNQLRSGLRSILAPNPSPMTYWGTNTFLLGEQSVAVIDPGPDHPDHLQSILDAVATPEQITHIFVTHPHLDHSSLAPKLAAATGAAIHAFGDAKSGRSDVMQSLVTTSDIGGGEGVDAAFQPDVTLEDGDIVETQDWRIQAIHLPGHMAPHLGFKWQDHIFCGDLIMAWSSSLISPPDGDLDQFLQSLDRLKTLAPKTLFPAHGPAIETPPKRITELETHLNARSDQILQTLTKTPQSLMDITTRVYTDLATNALPYAARNTLAHLIKWHGSGHAQATPRICETAMWTKG